MSRLVANEQGRVIASLGAEVDGLRHLRTWLELNGTEARFYVLARAHHPGAPPLVLHVNGQLAGHFLAIDSPVMTWHALDVSVADRQGTSEVTLSSAGSDMTAWSVAIDHAPPGGDALSIDGGSSWQSERIGYLHLTGGRYVVRARVPAGVDPAPGAHRWEDHQDARVKAFYGGLPAAARDASRSWDAVRALSTWIAESYDYRNTSSAQQYAPWDPEAILAWGARQAGHAGQLPVVMCVHYAVVLASACQSLGIPARCAALTGTINGFDGHFVTEVWLDELQRWAMIDPTYDVWVGEKEAPLGMHAIQQLGADVGAALSAGRGIEARLATADGRLWYEQNLRRGVCFGNRSLWPRSDFLTHPEATPAGHGATSYSELELVWDRESTTTDLSMFRYFADTEWFERKPTSTSLGAPHEN